MYSDLTHINGANNFTQSKASKQFLHQQKLKKQKTQIKQELFELQQKQQKMLIKQKHETINLNWNNQEESTISTASSSCSTAIRKQRIPNLSTLKSKQSSNIDQIYYQQQQQSDSQMFYFQQKSPLLSLHETTTNELSLSNETEQQNRNRSTVSIKSRSKISDETEDNDDKLNNTSNLSVSPIDSRRNSSSFENNS